MKLLKMNEFKKSGFTLVELLTVIAIIGVLAAILVPVVGKVRESAGETAGRAQFSQWAQAFELFRQEYGFYPDFATTPGNDVTTAEILINHNPERFYEALTGRKATGTTNDRIESTDEGYSAGNVRAASFYTFGEGEVETGPPFRIVDHFGNTEIVVLFDRNKDGVVRIRGNNQEYNFSAGGVQTVII